MIPATVRHELEIESDVSEEVTIEERGGALMVIQGGAPIAPADLDGVLVLAPNQGGLALALLALGAVVRFDVIAPWQAAQRARASEPKG